MKKSNALCDVPGGFLRLRFVAKYSLARASWDLFFVVVGYFGGVWSVFDGAVDRVVLSGEVGFTIACGCPPRIHCLHFVASYYHVPG